MFERNDAGKPAHDDNPSGLTNDYLARATAACEAGDAKLGLHLYLAAFEQAVEASEVPSEDAIMGLKQAWRVACSIKERSLAEYIFERLEPYLSRDEVEACTVQLQGLAFDRLAEFGFSRDDLEEMSEALSQGAMDMLMAPPLVVNAPHPPASAASLEASAASGPSPEPDAGPAPQPVDIFTYDTAPGYGTVIERMRSLGIGMAGDPDFESFVSMLNTRHGFDAMPMVDCLLFCSDAREDASRFMMATVGELGLPAVRMRMEESFQGVPMLSVSAQASDSEHLAALRRGFEGGGVLVLEDIDLWGAPMIDAADDMAGFFMAALSRGAREAVGLIRQAVENPDVYVLASASALDAVDPFFGELLYPMTCIDIDYPTAAERDDIWMDLARAHPSLRALNREELVRLSANMPRYDLYMAVREALEEAYKQGLVERRYQPVTRENLFDKLAAYQPLDSAEYAALENAVISDFVAGLDDLESLL
ncbi:ribonucleotide reductase subunit alpha [Adlercreutzia caecimuris]|jgi:hypothetical protein|uniref:ribonucleotide reductase subunit alpha n=1 Tax=Adlercreutzia caecimuris TaxID=671266 RepID=UPI0025711096|nr:ribonucleotide reductase subunit alpha [Adlercreutzia caecimuris]